MLLSVLFATTITGSLALRRIFATSISRSVTPVVTSTRKSTTSASSVAMTTCLRISSSKMSSELTTHPPVSTTENSRPFHSHLPYCLSRVVPACSLTMALRDLVSLLNSVLLPTLGLPTIATRFAMIVFLYHSTCKDSVKPCKTRTAMRKKPRFAYKVAKGLWMIVFYLPSNHYLCTQC